MTLEEYKKKITAIDDAAKKEKYDVSYEYAMSNNNVRVGDIICDGVKKIKVEEIKLGISFSSTPQCFYLGDCITKKGKPYKDGRRGLVRQSRLKTINGKKYEAMEFVIDD